MSPDWLPFCLFLLPLAAALLLSRAQASRVQAVAVATFAPVLTVAVASIGLALAPVPGHLFGFDRLSGMLAVLVALISLLVQRYGIRFMQADRRFVAFFANVSLLTAALLAFVTATHLLTLAAGWVMMSLALVPLLRHRQDWQPAAAAASRADRTFLVGDLAFLAGVGCLMSETDTGVIAELAALATGTPLQTVGMGLLVLAALTKTAILPFHGWLPRTMTAPTPVSALMHAGFVNAGGVVLTKLAGLLAYFPELLLAVFLLGAFTALYGSAVMQVQTDVKRQLGASTVGQMGFMLMQCGLGAFAAAMVHLVTHSLFKATLFLGAGAVVQQAADLKTGTPTTPLRRRAAGAALVAAVLVLVVGIFSLAPFLAGEGAGLILAVFAALVMAETSRSLLRQQASSVLVITGTLIAGGLVTAVYGGVLLAAKDWLGNAAPTLALSLTPLHLGVAVVFVCAAFVPHLSAAGLLPVPVRLKRRLYVRLLLATHSPDTFAGRNVS
jgi:NAD(P)H-quinone oxidoreductase subunit 5